MEQGRLDKKPCLAAAGAADDQDIFISCRFRILWAAGHGEAFRPGQRNVPIGNGVYVGRDILRPAPSRAAVLNATAIFLRVFCFQIHRQPDKRRPGHAQQQIQRMQAEPEGGKGLGEALGDTKQLFRSVEPRRQPHRLAELVKEPGKQQIRKVRQQDLFQLSRHRSSPRSLFLIFSPRSSSCRFACSLALVSRLRMDGFFSFARFFAENSRKAAVTASASLPLKNTR